MPRTQHAMTRQDEQVLVSLIVPAYNAARYIGFTIDSLMRQSHSSIEIIVVDDGSTDDTLEIASRYADGDDRITVITQENLGVATARNRAIKVAKGRYVGFVDADDVWHSTAVEKMLARFEESSPNVGVVYTWSTDIDAENRLIGGVHVSRAKGHVFPLLIFHNFLGNASSTLVRKRCLEEAGGYRPEFDLGCEDFDLYLRLAAKYEFEVVPEFLVAYRRTPHAMSSHTERMERAHQQVLDTVKCERPSVSARLLRSSKVNFYAYLAHSARSLGGHEGSLHWISKAFGTDPILTVCRIDLLASILRRTLPRSTERAAPPDGTTGRGDILCPGPRDDGSSGFRPPTSAHIMTHVKCGLASVVYEVLRWGRNPPSSSGA